MEAVRNKKDTFKWWRVSLSAVNKRALANEMQEGDQIGIRYYEVEIAKIK